MRIESPTTNRGKCSCHVLQTLRDVRPVEVVVVPGGVERGRLSIAVAHAVHGAVDRHQHGRTLALTVGVDQLVVHRVRAVARQVVVPQARVLGPAVELQRFACADLDGHALRLPGRALHDRLRDGCGITCFHREPLARARTRRHRDDGEAVVCTGGRDADFALDLLAAHHRGGLRFDLRRHQRFHWCRHRLDAVRVADEGRGDNEGTDENCGQLLVGQGTPHEFFEKVI